MLVHCENRNCYISDVLLSENNISTEHIIPNALGGHLKSPDLVCDQININLFAKLDALLANCIELSQLIKFKRERKDQPTIIGTSMDGLKYIVNNMQEGKLLPMKPIKVIDNTGKELLKFPASQKEEYFKSELKKNPNLKREDLEIEYIEVFEDTYKVLYFPNGLNVFATKDPFRSIAKIATNFAVLNNVNKKYFLGFIEFIKGSDDLTKIQLGYFYPKELLIYDLGDKEISHILYIKGCEKEKIIYCYIELFNTHCFIVNLCYNYGGPYFESSYIWDVLTAKELKKPITLNLTYDYLTKRRYLWYPEVEMDYKERLRRTSLVCGLKLEVS